MPSRNPFAVPKEPAPRLRTLRWSGEKNAFGRHRCFLARNGIYHGVGALGLVAGDQVLVPAYICRAAIDPIVARGVDVDFYRIGPACDVDLADIASRLGPKTRAVLVVHYFGFAQDVQSIAAFCRRNGLYLIEDCAHVFGRLNNLQLGTHGDISVFSWRKFLPVFDGGDLLINTDAPFTPCWERESALFTLKVAKNLFDQWAARHAWTEPVDKVLRVLKNTLLSRIGTSSSARAVLRADTGSLDFDFRLAALPMSRLSRCLLAHSRAEWIVKRRQENYRLLSRHLGSISVRGLFPDPLPGTCPWVYPVVTMRPNVHLELRRLGVPAVTWGGVRPAGVRAAEHPDGDRLYDHLLFLPIHQDLDSNAIERIAEAMFVVMR